MSQLTIKRGRQLIRELEQHQLLLLLDEVEKMTWNGFTRDLRQNLRGLADGGTNPPLRLVVAACTPLNILFPDSQMMPSPFQGVCIEEPIKPWDEATARDFIANRLAKTSVLFTEEEITQLVQESGGHPQRLMQLCHQTFARYLEGVQ